MTGPAAHHKAGIRHMNINPPHFDPDNPFPSTDCQHDDLRHLFFGPEIGEGKGEQGGGLGRRAEREHEARKVCAECPFLVDCALHGLEHEEYGVWGGLAERDRRAWGGRHPSGRHHPPNPAAVVKRLRAAGVDDFTITSLILRWRRRQRDMRRAA